MTLIPRITEAYVIAQGQILERGAVLAKTPDGWVAVDSSRTDGGQKARAILLEGVDTSSRSTVAPCMIRGQFSEEGATFGGVDTMQDHEEVLRSCGLYVLHTQRRLNLTKFQEIGDDQVDQIGDAGTIQGWGA